VSGEKEPVNVEPVGAGRKGSLEVAPPENVRGAGNARAKRKRLSRPRVIVDHAQIAALRAQGRSWRRSRSNLGLEQEKLRFDRARRLVVFTSYRARFLAVKRDKLT
jgi:hypothetical protein